MSFYKTAKTNGPTLLSWCAYKSSVDGDSDNIADTHNDSEQELSEESWTQIFLTLTQTLTFEKLKL